MGASVISFRDEEHQLLPSKWGRTLQELYSPFGNLESLVRLGNGHIHDTFEAIWLVSGERYRVVHQRVNSSIFGKPELVVRSIQLATDRVRTYFDELKHDDKVIELLALPSGNPGANENAAVLVTDGEGQSWRAFTFISDSTCLEVLSNEGQAFEAGACFGRFQAGLCYLSINDFPYVIPNFHDVPSRLGQLEQALSRAESDRLQIATGLLEEVNVLRDVASQIALRIEDGTLPLRVVHNDPKINNVLFDKDCSRAIAVLDLDLIQPGSPLYDFGDLVRSAGVPTAEDEQNLALVKPSKQFIIALKAGYEGALKGELTSAERSMFDQAPMTLAFELGVRFLTDFLNGDKYFKVSHPFHNFERARTQLHLAHEFYRLLQ